MGKNKGDSMKKKRAEKRTVKPAKAKKPTEKTEKKDQISEVVKQFDLPSVKIKDLKKISVDNEQEIIEEDQSMLPKKDLFRIDEVADFFSVTERTVRLWIDHGHLTAIKKGGIIRIPRKSVLDCHILDNRKVM